MHRNQSRCELPRASGFLANKGWMTPLLLDVVWMFLPGRRPVTMQHPLCVHKSAIPRGKKGAEGKGLACLALRVVNFESIFQIDQI